MKSLSPRQQSILNRIVETHIETALPVGSRFITDLYTELYHSSYSPATVRAEMGLLEEKGYLTHPHTSAGRLPTDLGYRYYVDHGLKEESLGAEVAHDIHQKLSRLPEAENNFAELASEILSRMSQELSLIFISEISQSRPHFFVQGSSLILEKPEFQDARKAGPVFKALEAKSTLESWLISRGENSKVSITIGEENQVEAFQDCTVISAGHTVQGRYSCAAAVVGPRRMRYAKAVPLVALMGKAICSILDDLEEV